MTCQPACDDIIGQCVDQLQVRYPILAAVIPVADAGTGIQVDITRHLRKLRMTDSRGRHAHIAGIMFRGTYRFTTAASNDVMIGWSQLGHAWQSIRLEDVHGHEYFPDGLDARSLVDDRWLRHLRAPTSPAFPANIAVNAGAQNNDVDVAFYYPLSRVGARGPEALEGLIPLAAIAGRANGLRFTVGGASMVTGHAGVTGAGFVTNSLEIYLDIVWLDAPVIDVPWQVETYTTTDLEADIRHPGATHEYLTVYALDEDNGSLYYDDYTSPIYSLNGDPQWSEGLTRAQHALLIQQHLNSQEFALEDADPVSVSSTNVRFGLVCGPLPHRRSGMAAGKIALKWASRTRTRTRLLHRSLACHTPQRVATLERAVPGCGKSVVGVKPNGYLTRTPSRNDILILSRR